MEINIIMYFQVAWITCFLILLMIFFAVNCLHRHRRRPLGVPGSDLDLQPLIPHDTDKSYAEEDSITSVHIENDAIHRALENSRKAGNCEESTLTLKEVLNKTWIARNKWAYIGIQLGLENDVEAIRLDHNNNTGECYCEMLVTWMRNETATWEKLIAALSSESVGYCELANLILAELQDVSESDVINDDATILMTNFKPMGEAYHCQYCGSYSLDQCLKNCSKLRTISDSSSFPYLDTTRLTEPQKHNLQSLLHDQARDMVTSFSGLVLYMGKSFKQRNIDPLEVATGALLISRRESSTRCMSLLSQKVDSVDKLIGYLVENNFISFFNYHIIQYIMTRFGDKADKRALLDYEEKFKEFCRRSVFEIPHEILGPIPKNEEKLVLKITEELSAHLPSGRTQHFEDRFSLNNVQIVCDKVAKALDLENSWRLTFLGASKGSIELTFSATNDVIDTIESQQLSLGIPSGSVASSSVHLTELQTIGIHLLCGPPGKPDAFEISCTGICLRWSKPKYNGCYPILYYVVHCRFVDRPGGMKRDTWRTEGETLSLKITRLPHNETLIFSVQAVISIGHGIESEESEYVELASPVSPIVYISHYEEA